MRKICFITGSRADWSPLSEVMKAIGAYENCHRQYLTTDGLYGHETFYLDQLNSITPDIVVLLGDRYETLMAASVAALLCIPIAHIHGGETTEGAVDDVFRHAISQLSTWHFVSHDKYRQRLEGMGIPKDNIYVCGAPGIDSLINIAPSSIDKPYALISLHPETNGGDDKANIRAIYNFIDSTGKNPITKLDQPRIFAIIVGANTDLGGSEIDKEWKEWQTIASKECMYMPSFKHEDWIFLMKYADVLIGNSSSFIFEGMTLGKKVVMIGNRQKGRYEDAVDFFNKEKYPYGKPGEISPKIAKILATVEIPKIAHITFL